MIYEPACCLRLPTQRLQLGLPETPGLGLAANDWQVPRLHAGWAVACHAHLMKGPAPTFSIIIAFRRGQICVLIPTAWRRKRQVRPSSCYRVSEAGFAACAVNLRNCTSTHPVLQMEDAVENPVNQWRYRNGAGLSAKSRRRAGCRRGFGAKAGGTGHGRGVPAAVAPPDR